MEVQAKLLRALQERKVRPVGGDAEIPFDARLISATSQDLESAVEEKRFRRDRKRPGRTKQLSALARSFYRRLARMDKKPGN